MKNMIVLLLIVATACSTTLKAPSVADESRTTASASKSSLQKIADMQFNKNVWELISFDELKTYENMWVISDLHGQLSKLVKLLNSQNAGKMLVPDGSWYKWNSKSKNNLIIVIGDNIDKGPDSVGVVRLLSEMKTDSEAKANLSKNNRIVLLLGNHEVEYLAFPLTIPQELNDSADAPTHRKWLGGKLGAGVKPSELYESRFGKTLKEFKLGAIVGSWMFTHSGYFDVKANSQDLHEYVTEIESLISNGEYKQLVDESLAVSAPLMRHNWFRKDKHRENMLAILDELNLEGSVFGHDPDAFSDLYSKKISVSDITTDYTGRMIGNDAGMSDEMNSPESMMKCPIQKILKQNGSMKLVNAKGTLCTQISASKETKIEIPE